MITVTVFVGEHAYVVTLHNEWGPQGSEKQAFKMVCHNFMAGGFFAEHESIYFPPSMITLIRLGAYK